MCGEGEIAGGKGGSTGKREKAGYTGEIVGECGYVQVGQQMVTCGANSARGGGRRLAEVDGLRVEDYQRGGGRGG